MVMIHTNLNPCRGSKIQYVFFNRRLLTYCKWWWSMKKCAHGEIWKISLSNLSQNTHKPKMVMIHEEIHQWMISKNAFSSPTPNHPLAENDDEIWKNTLWKISKIRVVFPNPNYSEANNGDDPLRNIQMKNFEKSVCFPHPKLLIHRKWWWSMKKSAHDEFWKISLFSQPKITHKPKMMRIHKKCSREEIVEFNFSLLPPPKLLTIKNY